MVLYPTDRFTILNQKQKDEERSPMISTNPKLHNNYCYESINPVKMIPGHHQILTEAEFIYTMQFMI